MPAPLTTRARAKVNLTLRVIGKRPDGYHELESLVAFAGIGDTLTLEPGEALSLSIAGPFGEGLAGEPDNLILRAARALANEAGALRMGRFLLVKRLPLASGIGGGSADAAGALRLLGSLNGIAGDDPVLLRAAARVGADVPICLDSRARMMSGLGEVLGPPLTLSPLFAVLVNPGVAVPTAAVFRALGLRVGETHQSAAGLHPEAIFEALSQSGNDLEAPARGLAPVIGEVLKRIAMLPGCSLARMSGSGATCFALFDDCRQSADAAKTLRREQPDWWVKATVLR